MSAIIPGEYVAIEYPPVDTELMNATDYFTLTDRTDWGDVTAMTATDKGGRTWTLISDAAGNDVVITPTGRHFNLDNPQGLTTAVKRFLNYITEIV